MRLPRWLAGALVAAALLAPPAAQAAPATRTYPLPACQAGRASCVDKVIRTMRQRWRPLDARCDYNAVFALQYLRTTEEFRRSLRYVAYDQPERVVNLDAAFADLYFDARDDFSAGRDVPAAWRIAFKAADARTQTGAGDVLLGINAHIRRDLPFALYRIWRDGRGISYEDNQRVNEFLRRVDAGAELARRYDPRLAPSPATPAATELIIAWREEAWQAFERLRDAETEAERATVAAGIEAYAADWAAAFREATRDDDAGGAVRQRVSCAR